MLNWSRLAVNKPLKICTMLSLFRGKFKRSVTTKFAPNSQPSLVCDKVSLLSNESQQINAK